MALHTFKRQLAKVDFGAMPAAEREARAVELRGLTADARAKLQAAYAAGTATVDDVANTNWSVRRWEAELAAIEAAGA